MINKMKDAAEEELMRINEQMRLTGEHIEKKTDFGTKTNTSGRKKLETSQ